MNKYVLAGISFVSGAVLVAAGSPSNDQMERITKQSNAFKDQVQSCQQLTTKLDTILGYLDHDYKLFALDMADYMQGNISTKKFIRDIDQFSKNKDIYLREYQSAKDKYADRCFPKMGKEVTQ